jgi:hypothetical protein
MPRNHDGDGESITGPADRPSRLESPFPPREIPPVGQAAELVDHGIRDLPQSTLTDEEAQLDQVARMGLQDYLSKQTG